MKTLLIVTLSMLSSIAFGKGVDPSHQSCSRDLECQIISLACACIHNATCMRSSDKEDGFIDAVNRKFVGQYQERSKCSKSEIEHCSKSGACAMQGEWIPQCQNQRCTALFKAKVF